MTTTTPTQTRTTTVQWTSGTNLAAGLWLIAAPFALGYADVSAAGGNDIIVGLLIANLATISAVTGSKRRDGLRR